MAIVNLDWRKLFGKFEKVKIFSWYTKEKAQPACPFFCDFFLFLHGSTLQQLQTGLLNLILLIINDHEARITWTNRNPNSLCTAIQSDKKPLGRHTLGVQLCDW